MAHEMVSPMLFMISSLLKAMILLLDRSNVEAKTLMMSSLCCLEFMVLRILLSSMMKISENVEIQ